MEVWHFIEHKLLGGTAVVLLYVLESRGSSPGRQGFKMAVAGDGTFCGSIGGGIMEHKFVEMAKAVIHRGSPVAAVHKQVHNKNSAQHQSGMICSGEQTIFLHLVQPDETKAIKEIVSSFRAQRNGTLRLSPTGIAFSYEILAESFSLQLKAEQDFLLLEKTGPKNILHIIGGGHCALALSRLMSSMDFYIHVYDERSDLNTMADNSFVQEKHLLENYDQLTEKIADGDNVYVVIMTMGYRTDEVALRAVVHKKARYIGVLGSKNKMEKLLANNAALDWIAKVKSPIGLQIKSQTPEEIAVSIAAEIIAEKNKDQ